MTDCERLLTLELEMCAKREIRENNKRKVFESWFAFFLDFISPYISPFSSFFLTVLFSYFFYNSLFQFLLFYVLFLQIILFICSFYIAFYKQHHFQVSFYISHSLPFCQGNAKMHFYWFLATFYFSMSTSRVSVCIGRDVQKILSVKRNLKRKQLARLDLKIKEMSTFIPNLKM